jgi:hypothetical protein
LVFGLFALVAMSGAALAQQPPTERIPEPGTLALLAGGVAAAVYLRHRRRK